jgi:hypothetical protein
LMVPFLLLVIVYGSVLCGTRAEELGPVVASRLKSGFVYISRMS